MSDRQVDPDWHKIRGGILHRDNYRCRICGQPATEVHHRIKRRRIPRPSARADWSNLISTCARHGAYFRNRP